MNNNSNQPPTGDALIVRAIDPLTGGTFSVRIAEGTWYTRHCNVCGRDNGIFIDAPERPIAGESPGKCVGCESPDVGWRRLED